MTPMSRSPQDFGPGSRARNYFTVGELANNLESVDIDILTAGDPGDVWDLTLMGSTVHYTVLAGDGVANVAAGLRLAADTVTGVTVSGMTSHISLTRTAAITVFDAPMFEKLYTAGPGTAEVTITDTEQVIGRGELRIVQSTDDPTPLDLFDNPAAVNLGGAAAFRILAKSGITSAGTEAVTGDMGVSPAAAASITGFALTLDGGGQFSTSAEVTGSVYASDYAAPTPATLTAAVSAMEAAYTDAAGRSPGTTELNGGLIGGLTLVPGVYKWTTGVTITGADLTLNGSATDRWIFQINGVLSLAAARSIVLTGGAVASNVIWQVAGGMNIGVASTFRGDVLSATTAVIGASGVVHGRLLTQTATTLGGSTVVGA